MLALYSNFSDGRRIDVGNGGDVMLTFDLGNGQQWRKRVWPRKGYPTKLLRWNSVEVRCLEGSS